MAPDARRLVAVDGPPGTGKTTRAVADSANWPWPSAALSFSRAAAAVLATRGVKASDIGTVDKVCWPHAKVVARLGVSGRPHTPEYQRRRVLGKADPAVTAYVTAAERRKLSPETEERLAELTAWGGPEHGPAPDWLWDQELDGALKYAVTLGRWLDKGAPLDDFEGYAHVLLDEAQDSSPLQVASALSLVRPGGTLEAVGDPGQAIFSGDELPAAWRWATEKRELTKGYRVGEPVAGLAADVLRPFYDRPSSNFAKEGETRLLQWGCRAPRKGLVLCHSRRYVKQQLERWGLGGVWLSPDKAKVGDLTVCCIHSAKGSEADDVYIANWSAQRLADFDRQRTQSLRVMYVALTRARKRVFLDSQWWARFS